MSPVFLQETKSDRIQLKASPHAMMMFLAALGASVIHIERSHGDNAKEHSRFAREPGQTCSGYFSRLNNIKKNLVLHLKQEYGRGDAIIRHHSRPMTVDQPASTKSNRLFTDPPIGKQ